MKTFKQIITSLEEDRKKLEDNKKKYLVRPKRKREPSNVIRRRHLLTHAGESPQRFTRQHRGVAGQAMFFSSDRCDYAREIDYIYAFDEGNSHLYMIDIVADVTFPNLLDPMPEDRALFRRILGSDFKRTMKRDITDEEIDLMLNSEHEKFGNLIMYSADDTENARPLDVYEIFDQGEVGWVQQRIQSNICSRMGHDFVQSIDDQGTVFFNNSTSRRFRERILKNLVYVGTYQFLDKNKKEIDAEIDREDYHNLYDWAVSNNAKKLGELNKSL